VSEIADLVEKWERDASVMEDYADARGAAVCRLHVAELREAVRAWHEEVLTLAQAALESGYTEDHLRHLVSDGEIANAGRKGSPRIRRRELPIKKKRQRAAGPSPEKAAAVILGHGGGT